MERYHELELHQILLGIKNGVDITKYQDNRIYDSMQMKQIRLGLQSGIEVDKYYDPDMDSLTMENVREALELGLNTKVDKFLNNKIDCYQLEKIVETTKSKVNEQQFDLDKYRKLGLDQNQIEQMRYGFEYGVDLYDYVVRGYDWDQLVEISKGIKRGLDVSKYDKKEINNFKMALIRYGIEEGLDVDKYNTIEDENDMHKVRINLLVEKLPDKIKKIVSDQIKEGKFYGRLSRVAIEEVF